MASAIHQHESAIGIHVTPPFWTSSHLPPHSIPSRLSQSTSFGFPASYIKLPPAIYFTHGNVYVSMLFSGSSPPSPSPSVHKSVLYVCVSKFLWESAEEEIASTQNGKNGARPMWWDFTWQAIFLVSKFHEILLPRYFTNSISISFCWAYLIIRK